MVAGLPITKRWQFAGVAKAVTAHVAIMIGLAAPVYAGSSADDVNFFAALDKAGISYDNPGQAITAGNAVCQLMDEGRSGTEVIWQLVTSNQGLSSATATKFAGIAASIYCPQYLTNVSHQGAP